MFRGVLTNGMKNRRYGCELIVFWSDLPIVPDGSSLVNVFSRAWSRARWAMPESKRSDTPDFRSLRNSGFDWSMPLARSSAATLLYIAPVVTAWPFSR